MIRKIPIISSSLKPGDLAGTLLPASADRNLFCAGLESLVGKNRLYLTDSGISAFFLILKALIRVSDRREVVVPAYTAGSLVVAIRAAGCTPVLCDVSLEDFNLDAALLDGVITPRTLAVTCCHLFGIAMGGIREIKSRFPGVFLIEDCAQSMGSTIAGSDTGKYGDISFFSFNRGKNLPLSGGGCIVARHAGMADAIEFPETAPRRASAAAWWRAAAFYAACQPLIYGAAYPLISRFKETVPPTGVNPDGMDDFSIRLGVRLLRRARGLWRARYEHGSFLLEGLRGIPGLRLPRIPPGSRPAFNRLPLLFEDPAAVQAVRQRLWRAGVESSRMYLKPLHQMFDLGYARDSFPNARRLAEGLLALPCHPDCSMADLKTMVGVVRS